jgi:predicted lipoprotein
LNLYKVDAMMPVMEGARKALRALGRPLAAACLLCVTGAAAAGQLPADLGARLAHGYIEPAMLRFQHSAERLHASLQGWCATPATADAAEVQADFGGLIEAWSGIEFLRFGPLVAANRYERIYFWPDPRGITLRQVQGMLAQSNQPIPDAAGLAKQSVALQGLPALEYVLYRKDGLLAPANAQADAGRENDARACAYAVAIAGNLAAVGDELGKEWAADGDYARQFAAPSSTNALYRNQQEVAGEAIKALSTGLQFARDVKLVPMLAADMKAARSSKAPFWRSGLSTRAMGAALEGMRQFYTAGSYIYTGDEAWIDGSIQHEMAQARDVLLAMHDKLDNLLGTGEGYRRFTLVSLILKNAKGMVDEHMAPAFGVRIGFNALDGD